ncbi:uncharacterized protein [Amphiura filiformis]|uniref:uncharacterized protein n=1 Tax=Amphiura filiformis TaxID=82378 RepID=UPI003B224F01
MKRLHQSDDNDLKKELMLLDAAMFNPLQQRQTVTVEQLGARNKRFPNAFRKGKDNIIAMSATGDGNCFFHSISLLLFGNEDMTTLLRLFCAYKAAQEFDNYVHHLLLFLGDGKKADPGSVQFYIQEVCSDAQFQRAPKDKPTSESLMEYCVTEQIKDCLKDRKYAGIGQIQMMAAALGEAITLFEEHDEREEIEYTTYCKYPAIGTTNDNHLCVLLCKTSDKSRVKNHYVPVVKGRAGLRRIRKAEMTTATTTSKCLSIDDFLGDQCIQSKIGMCCVPRNKGEVDMIQCGRCFCWFHGECAGVSPSSFTEREYVCCDATDVSIANQDVLRWPAPKPGNRRCREKDLTVTIKLGDVWSTNPNCGINGTVVDFYVRIIQNDAGLQQQLVRLFTCTDGITVQNNTAKQTQRNMDDVQQLYIFPVKPKNNWHWVAICFICIDHEKCFAFVMDSLHGNWDPLVMTFYNHLKKIRPSTGQDVHVQCKVQKQQGNDCGLMMLQNIRELTKMMPLRESNLTQPLMIPSPLSGDQMRMHVRSLLYEKASLML